MEPNRFKLLFFCFLNLFDHSENFVIKDFVSIWAHPSDCKKSPSEHCICAIKVVTRGQLLVNKPHTNVPFESQSPPCSLPNIYGFIFESYPWQFLRVTFKLLPWNHDHRPASSFAHHVIFVWENLWLANGEYCNSSLLRTNSAQDFEGTFLVSGASRRQEIQKCLCQWSYQFPELIWSDSLAVVKVNAPLIDPSQGE